MALDYDSPVGQVRLLISDVNETKPILADDQIDGFLELNGQNVRRAAADALDAIADSEVLVSKVIRSQDLNTDGAKVADALRAHADRLRKQADELDPEGGDFAFDIIPVPSRSCRPELSERPQVWGL